ncbi:DUF5677 domain-containing protein [Paenibacillus sp. GD4]|uniref:DUF5677 domain-containing protein n=1 Tax=Paenibacillus sp. GD4 TaxID=3068890 RepID=UPI0027968421|nr:DUF5677 domain-containing protein [Paenibacillus sp. GD4]MDQ1912507.1 DUF5677 domain-containing protein [Paenibacillus sp. GD4]
MSVKLSPTEIYSRWEKELEVIKDLPYAPADTYRNLIVMLQTCEVQLSEINVKKRDIYNQMLAISRFLMAHVFQLGNGAYQLAKTGFGNPGLIICRSILESLTELSYLWLVKKINPELGDVERDAWVEYINMNRSSVLSHWEQFKQHKENKGETVEKILEDPVIEQVREKAAQYIEDYPHSKNGRNWAKITPLVKRARAVDDTGWLKRGIPEKGINGFDNFSLEEEYITIYKHTSEYAHGESGSIQSLYETQGNRGTIIIGASDSNVITTLGLATNYLLVFLYVFAILNRLDLRAILNELERQGFIAPK